MTYAKQTSVSVEKSVAEIEKLLARYGATHFSYSKSPESGIVLFQTVERWVKFLVPIPSRDDPEFQTTATGRRRTKSSTTEAWEQECRRRWRALLLTIKGKLVSAESGVETFENAFLANIVLPGGSTVGEMVVPEIETAYLTGKPMMLLSEFAS